MSSCLSGGGRAYGFELEIVTKSPSPSTQTLHSSSSPSSTLSESSNSPLAISTRKARTPRKRPNQTYNEAAAILSTAYPNIFSIRHLTKNPPCKFTKPQQDSFFDDSPELLLPFPVIDDLGIIPIHQQPIREKPRFQFEPKVSNFIEKSCLEIDSRENSSHLQDGFEEDFDAESILDEEIEEGGIDSIMGNLSVNNDSRGESNDGNVNSCFGYPMGLGFGGKVDFGFGMKLGVRAFKPVDEGDWWRFPAVDVREISPKFNNKFVSTEKKKKKKKMEKLSELKSSPAELPEENSVPSNYNLDLHEEKSIPKPNSGGLLLKLNYDGVLNSWSGRGSPFSDDVQGSDLAGADAHARLAQIDLFPESGGVREASVLRYKEKRRTRLFSKKIRYQVRKVNADRRPRMKGRFVRRPNSSSNNAQR